MYKRVYSHYIESFAYTFVYCKFFFLKNRFFTKCKLSVFGDFWIIHNPIILLQLSARHKEKEGLETHDALKIH